VQGGYSFDCRQAHAPLFNWSAPLRHWCHWLAPPHPFPPGRCALRPNESGVLRAVCYVLYMQYSVFGNRQRQAVGNPQPGNARARRVPDKKTPQVARMVPIGPGGIQSGFSILRYVRRDFRKKNRVRGLPAPPVAPRSWVP
jgi:hypothetical protein